MDWLSQKSTIKFQSVVASEQTLKYTNVITAKKFYGLNVLFQKGYTHVGVFDAECEVVKPFDSNTIYPIIYNKRELKCNLSRWGGALVKANASILNIENDLTNITDNFIQYWWFNEVCVYERDNFIDFFSYIKNIGDGVYAKWEYFDYLLYGCYLLKYKNFKLNKLLQHRYYNSGAIENNFHNLNNESEIFQSYADCNRNHAKYDHIKILIHTDRH